MLNILCNVCFCLQTSLGNWSSVPFMRRLKIWSKIGQFPLLLSLPHSPSLHVFIQEIISTLSALHSPDDTEIHALEGIGKVCNLWYHMKYLPALRHGHWPVRERESPEMQQGLRSLLLDLILTLWFQGWRELGKWTLEFGGWFVQQLFTSCWVCKSLRLTVSLYFDISEIRLSFFQVMLSSIWWKTVILPTS